MALLKKEVIKTLGYEAAARGSCASSAHKEGPHKPGSCQRSQFEYLQASNTEGNLEYRRLLIRALHACTGSTDPNRDFFGK